MNSMIKKNGLILAAFSLVTTGLIALTFGFTKDKIEAVKERQLLSTLNQVVDPAMHDNELHLDCVLLPSDPMLGSKPQRVFRSRLNGQNTALILETTAPNGYSGAIDMVVAINTNNTVLGARVVDHKETPGLGDKIELRISDWILSFADQTLNEQTLSNWTVKKDGGQFDQFTGATITPRAVVKAVRDAALFGQRNMQRLFDLPANCKTANTSALGSDNSEAAL